MTLDECNIGDIIYYRLPHASSNGRPRDLYLSVSVLSVGPKRVVVRPVGSLTHRILLASSLVAIPPEGAWIK
jgi:hypothetical protein